MSIEQKLVGRYQIVKKLGQGGMGAVYHAYDPQFKRDVALKVLDHRFSKDKKFLSRFQREAEVVAQIDHPGLVPIYDYGEDNGELFLVMPLMAGGTLGERLKREGTLSLAEATDLIQQIAPALDATHAQGIVHRDLKPDNILYDGYGVPHVADFGIVKLAAGQGTITQGNMVGTPAYMSPEQVKGRADLDGRSDIYSLGIILFHMLTGQRPYYGENLFQIAFQHINAPIPSICEANPALPAGCETVIRRSLNKDETKRYPTVAAMAADLSRVHTLPVVEADAIIPEAFELPDDAPRGRRPAWLWLAAVLILAAGGGGAWWIFTPPAAVPTPPPTAVPVAAVPTSTPSPTPSPSPTAAQSATPSPTAAATDTPAPTQTPAPTATPLPVQQPLGVANAADLALAQQLVGASTPLNHVAASPDDAWLSVASPRGVALYRLPELVLEREISPVAAEQSAWSADGAWLATSQADGVHIWDTSTWAETSQWAGGTAVALAWSPVADELLLGLANGTVARWAVGEAEASDSWSNHRSRITALAWTADGTAYASASGDNTVWLYELTTGQSRSIFRQGGASGLAWSADGQALATAGADGFVRLASRAGAEVGSLANGAAVTSLAWLDESTMAFGTADGRIRQWRTTERQATTLYARHADVAQLVWLPTRNALLTVGQQDQTVRLWGVAAGAETAVLFDYATYSQALWVAWAPKDERLAVGTAEGTVQIWDSTTGRIVSVLGGHEQGLQAVAWSPDGRLVATAGRPDNNVKIWEAETGALLAELTGHTATIAAVAWSPDSTQVAASGADSQLLRWDITNPAPTRSVQVASLGQVLALAWSPDGAWIAVGGQTGIVQLVPLSTTDLTITLNAHAAPVKALAWSADGAQWASADNSGNILLWSAEVDSGGEPVLQWNGGVGVRSLAWSADGALVAAPVGSAVRLWGAATAVPAATLENQHPFSGNTAFSADGQWLATVTAEGLVGVWGVAE